MYRKISTYVNKGFDSISVSFTPCDVDDVNNEDIANAMQLSFENRAIKDDEEVDDIDMERVEEEAEAAQGKEKDYLSWIERDGMAHYFHWGRENEHVIPQSENSKYLFWETWVRHRCGKPENKPRKTTKELHRHSQKVGCRAELYVHKLKAGSDVDPAYETKRRQELVLLTYYYKHQDHVLGDGDDFQYLRISSRMKNKI
ncbi:hypothetical protein BGZ50_003900 [Haplosporangium sp. Z 11]|nr:hypothetical protein BGZ50_003900 [Haplosporangium sp. Z 11]